MRRNVLEMELTIKVIPNHFPWASFLMCGFDSVHLHLDFFEDVLFLLLLLLDLLLHQSTNQLGTPKLNMLALFEQKI